MTYNIIDKEGGREKEFIDFIRENSGLKVVGAEVGVEQGKYSKVLADSIPDLTLYLIDPWQAYRTYREHVSQDKLDGFAEITRERLQGADFIVIRDFSVPAASTFGDDSLDFVYIDANHSYEDVMKDIIAWTPKVKKGGIVAGHDYKNFKGQKHIYGVVDAVNDYCRFKEKELTIWRGDKSPTWSFIK